MSDDLLLAACAKLVPLNTMDIVVREIRIQGILGYPNMFPQTIQLISQNKMKVEQIITKKIQLDEIVREGFEVLLDHPPEAKILVDMDLS